MVESGNPKAIGWLSSIVAIILALMLLHAFPLMGNWIDKQRAGEGKYQFDEDLCFDITKETEFDNTITNSPSPQHTHTGVGACAWYYNAIGAAVFSHNQVTIMNIPINGTMDGYGVSVLTESIGSPRIQLQTPEHLYINLNFTKKKVLDLDISRIDIYLDISGVSFNKMKCDLRDEDLEEDLIPLGEVSLGNVTKLTIKVVDLLKLNTFGVNDKLMLDFYSPSAMYLPSGAFVVFDMQWYCIDEIPTPTLTRLAGWMSLMNIGILILVFISFPQVQVLGRFNNIGERLKKI